ncbi:MAG: nicotinate phosphoribosyltransferase [Candidatus Lokiarchaeota archaeon]|nr:nicotinate phosphoribosyltransferase [Candidatus Lokiarchaeota archaeon]
MEKDLSDYVLLTDYYEFSMANGYILAGDIAHEQAVFDYFFRSIPFNGSYAILAGTENLLDILSNFKFTDEIIEYLQNYDLSDQFLDYLSNMENQITVRGIDEGRVVFANEPLLQVQGPLVQCQLLETFLLNSTNFPTLCATKANRMWLTSGKQPILEFGARRAQGPNGANLATYAAMIGGCSGTSNVMAAREMGIKALGTQAHSWIMSFNSEYEAFKQYIDIYPDSSILLVDTYDTLKSGVPNAIKIGKYLRERGHDLKSIRLDSGDLASLSKEARIMLDEAGFKDTKIIVSSDIDEYKISSIQERGGKVDIWGIGTKLATAYEDPALNGVYKLTEISNDPRIKVSGDYKKISIPGIKTLIRFYVKENGNSRMVRDVVFLKSELDSMNLLDHEVEHKITDNNPFGDDFYEPYPENQQDFDSIVETTNATQHESMLSVLFKDGKRTRKKHSWEDARENMESDIAKLPKKYKNIKKPVIYPILISEELKDLRKSLIGKYEKMELK